MIIAKTLAGLEEILANELKELGAKNIQILKRAVGFDGDKEMVYKSNYLCRCALKILKPIASFPAASEEELYKSVKKIDWTEYLSPDLTFAIDGVVNTSNLTHSYYVALKTKDAIADFFTDKMGRRPSVDTQNPDQQFSIFISQNQGTIYLDSSGDSLHKRGYKKTVGQAPLNEVLAAGLVLLSGWDKKTPLIDPFCGSGTILIEAAMLALNIPAGYYREAFAFQKWQDFDSDLWEKVRTEADGNINDNEVPIVGADISAEAINMANQNIHFAKLHKDITLVNMAFQKFKPPYRKGIMITNPPYGERIKKYDMIDFYKMIGDALKKNYAGYQAWIIAADKEAFKFVGLRPSEKYDVYNAKLPCKFAKFELYEGSKKQKNKR